MTLDEIRKRIDAIDEQLLPLFIERMKCAQDVAQAKRELSLPIFNAQRENEILARVAAEAGDFAPEAKMLYTTLMALNRSRQHKLLNSGTDIRDEIQTALQKETSLKEVSSGKKLPFKASPVLFLMRPQLFCSLTATFIHTRVLKMYLKLSKTEPLISAYCQLKILPQVLWSKYMTLS